MKNVIIDTRRLHNKCCKGTVGSYYHIKQKKAKIIRKITGQVLQLPDGRAMNITVSIWKNKIGQYSYTAREIIRQFDIKQYCWSDNVVGARLKTKHIQGCAWALTTKRGKNKKVVSDKMCKGSGKIKDKEVKISRKEKRDILDFL